MSCPFAHDDAAYVLGALSPAERHDFEEHLAECESCGRAVTEFSGLPGLLTRIDPAVLEAGPVSEPVPETLLPRLQRRVRRHQHRRTATAAGLAAAAAAAVVAGSFTLTDVGTGTPSSAPTTAHSTTAPGAREMTPVGSSPVHATVAFEPVVWGTRLQMFCSYDAPGDAYGSARPATYVLVVRTRDGGVQQVATWRSLPGRTMRLSAATSAPRSQIASVEVRTAAGQPVLRLHA